MAALVSWVLATPIMRLLTSEAYVQSGLIPGADTALRLLALPMFFNSLILFSFYVLLSRDAWRPLLVVLCLGVLVSLGGNIVLIPRYGFVGAGMVSIGTHALLCLLLLPLVWKVCAFGNCAKGGDTV
ncbi:polysaccharide biosynthesis C-terminal domain-containing protein [Candidatus Peregrinibacteria bacterium]|nr:polysaccharide biosynthesis C-terminal domain-containing protein [Candidatus Peregrinibacteria bacterium]